MTNEVLKESAKLVSIHPPVIPKNSKIMQKVHKVNGELKEYSIGNEVIFIFALAVKGMKCYDSMMEQDIEAIATMWYAAYERMFDELGLDEDDVCMYLESTMKSAKYSSGILSKAITQAEEGPEPIEANHFKGRKLRFLTTVCYYLQQAQQKGDPFFLKGDRAGEICGQSGAWGYTALQKLVRAGIISRIKKGNIGHCSRYVYISLATKPIEQMMDEIASHNKRN